MPRFLNPKRSTPHRVAAIALYRALLSRCPSAALPDEERVALRNAIQNKFRQHRKLQSPYQLSLAFRSGYETLDHLDAATAGNTASSSFLTSLIASLPRGLTRAPPPKRLPRPIHPSKKELACLPPERAVLNVRPYQTMTSGPRHVPVLCSANGVPFLRLKKPQPASLGRVIRQKMKKNIQRFDERIVLGNYWMPIAEQEDEWDAMIDELLRKPDDDDGKWVDAVVHADQLNMWQNMRALAADRAIARKMQDIVDAETELALKERQKVVRGRLSSPIRRFTKREKQR